jgi:hypothetical protein
MTAPHSPPRPDDITHKIDLNVTQVAAAALAAVTAAVLGSGLGAAGTVIGAAGASVITTVGTALYKASLERSRDRVRSLARRPRPWPASHERSREADPAHPMAAHSPLDDEQLIGSGLPPQDRSRWFATLRWGAVVVGALGAFVLAMMVITGFEWANGQTVGGNGKGTTIGQVVTEQSPRQEPANPPVSRSPAEPASETPTKTTEPSPTSTSISDDDTDVRRRPAATSDTPKPSEATSTPPVIPTRLPGVGD